MKNLRVQFIPQMVDDSQDSHQHEKAHDSNRVCRNGESDNRHIERLDHSFYRMKTKGGPRRGIGRAMMNFMPLFIKLRQMQQSMGPVKIGVMYQEHHEKTKNRVYKTVFTKV